MGVSACGSTTCSATGRSNAEPLRIVLPTDSSADRVGSNSRSGLRLLVVLDLLAGGWQPGLLGTVRPPHLLYLGHGYGCGRSTVCAGVTMSSGNGSSPLPRTAIVATAYAECAERVTTRHQ